MVPTSSRLGFFQTKSPSVWAPNEAKLAIRVSTEDTHVAHSGECSAGVNDARTPFVLVFEVLALSKLCSPPNDTSAPSHAVLFRSPRSHKVLDTRPKVGSTKRSYLSRIRLLTSAAVSRNRSPNATNAYARSGRRQMS